MSLTEYARKRRFEDTPEPKPGPLGAPTGSEARFFVQRHHASHLHYDFRLEIAGTLKSWAVPKGPTLDPAVKHFAAMVEDHPLDYGNFEGNIPAGNYGAGSVMLWDRGTFAMLGEMSAEQQLARGDFKFHLRGEKLNGDFALVRMKGRAKGNEWLLLKKRDAAAVEGWDPEDHARSILTGRTQEEIAKDLPPSKKKTKAAARKASPEPAAGARPAPMPESVTPMAATLVTELPAGAQWKVEVKWDGVRALCFVDRGELRIFSRTGHRCERQYPELTVLPRVVRAEQAILDGEIAVLDATGVASFEKIQPRIMTSDAAAIAHLSRTNPARIFVFDILYLDGYDLRDVPFQERRKILERVLQPREPVLLSSLFDNAPELTDVAREHGLEGLVAKCVTSTYQPRRSSDWLKWKAVLEQEFIICGYTPGERDFFGSLVLGLYRGKELVYSGNVGTGFNQKTLKQLFELMQPLVTGASPFSGGPKLPKGSVFLRPSLVCQVKFTQFTKDGILRAPVYLGLRPDVPPEKCVREVAQPPDAVQPKPKKSAAKAAAPPREAAGLLDSSLKEATLTIDGHPLKFTNLAKVFYPRQGYTKRDLLNYYDAVSGLLLPHLKDRPLTLKRYPNGIDHPHFFQKDSPHSFPDWLRFETVDDLRYVLAEDRAALLYLTNLGCIDQNPYQSRVPTIHHPDWILIDLDPQECGFERIVEAAGMVRELLEELGLRGYPKTTGGDGMHVYIPIQPVYTYEQSRQFAEVMARLVVQRRPQLFTTPRSVAKREKGRVYFDYLQNGEGKTIAAPYVARAYDGAPVATPLDWSEVAPGLDPKQFHIRNAMARFEQRGDLFAGVLRKPQKLEKAFRKLSALLS